jgi:radical SAM superfamily enzyme YgiQ (UPF0313 family)
VLQVSKIKEQIKLVGLNARFTHSCLALFYVRNELEKNCPDVEGELLQFTINDNYYEMLLRLSKGGPRYIFFSAAVWNSSLIEKLTRDLQICLPACRVVIGGPQASVLDDRLNRSANSERSICTVVLGEIEAIGEEFYRDLQEGFLQSRYRGSFFSMKNRCFDYPYRLTDFTLHLNNRHIYYESSRGCPFACTYCLSATEKGLYHKELAVVMEEMRDILSHNPKVVRFIDRTFNDVPDRALAIWKFLLMEGGETLFHFEMSPDRFTKEMFEFLETLEPGRFQFEIGIQSTSEKTLEAVNRRVEPGEAHRTIVRLVNLDTIHLHVDLILGLPYETRESFADSFRDVFAMGAHYIQMGLLKILPDTPICHGAHESGYLHCSEPPYSILQTRWMDHTSLSELYWFCEGVEKFHNNRYFVSLWRYLRKQKDDIYLFFQELISICQASGFFQLASTQELMCTKLAQVISGRQDRDLIIELLRYDWLRCGFRFLPACLKIDSSKEQPEQTKSDLYQALPPEMEGVYRRNNRNQFFRKSYFLRISQEALLVIGYISNASSPCLCILQDRETSLFAYNKFMIL